jgi:OOP family OmpA-OmpF porin
MMVDASALDVRPTSGRYVWSATRDAQRVTLSGAVPGRAAREALLASARAAMPPPLEVVDAMQLAPGAPGGDWVGTARAGLTALASLSSGEVTLSDRILTVAGDGPMITVRELDARMQAGAVPAPFETRLRLRADGETFVPELGGVDLFSGPPAADDCQDAFDAVMQRNVINFASGRAEIDEESIATLDKLAVVARRCTGFAILVEGHTDSEGELQRNIRLSERRAEAVVQHLAGAGVPTERMSTRGFGPTRPVASNDDETGRAANRRIEFTVTR